MYIRTSISIYHYQILFIIINYSPFKDDDRPHHVVTRVYEELRLMQFLCLYNDHCTPGRDSPCLRRRKL